MTTHVLGDAAVAVHAAGSLPYYVTVLVALAAILSVIVGVVVVRSLMRELRDAQAAIDRMHVRDVAVTELLAASAPMRDAGRQALAEGAASAHSDLLENWLLVAEMTSRKHLIPNPETP